MMRSVLLAYSSFVVACLLVILAFLTATTYTQLTVAILLYPVLVWFAYRTFPHKRGVVKAENTQIETDLLVKPIKETEEEGETVSTDIEKKTIGIADIDKRVFLKLIGGAGLTLFLFSLFNKKAGGLFSENTVAAETVALKDTTGDKINPAQNQPTDGYKISEVIDTDTSAFYGFTNKTGAWYIMKGDTETGSFRYAVGASNFPSNWNNRENLNYDYYNKVFNND